MCFVDSGESFSGFDSKIDLPAWFFRSNVVSVERAAVYQNYYFELDFDYGKEGFWPLLVEMVADSRLQNSALNFAFFELQSGAESPDNFDTL